MNDMIDSKSCSICILIFKIKKNTYTSTNKVINQKKGEANGENKNYGHT